jgi:hypothetical protein
MSERDPFGQPRFERFGCRRGRHRGALEHVAKRRTSRVEIRAQVRPFAVAHPIQLAERVRHRPLDQVRQSRILVARLGALAHRHRLRKTQHVTGRQRTGNEATLAGAIQRARQRFDDRVVDLDLHHRLSPCLHGNRDLDPPARDPLLHQRPQPRLDWRQRRRRAQLQIEKAVVHSLDGDGHRRRLPFACQGREPGHRLDH